MTEARVREINGGEGHDYRLFKFTSRGAPIGWIVVANTDSGSMQGASFEANHEYWYLNDDFTRLRSYTIEVDSQGDWPATWTGPTSGTVEFVVNKAELDYHNSTEPAPHSHTYFQPTDTSVQPFAWGWIWPTATVDGSNKFWSTQLGPYLDGDPGASWDYRLYDPGTLEAITVADVIPRQ